MPSTGHHVGLSGAGAPPSEHGTDGAAARFRPSRTMPLRVEFRRQLTRRRTQITMGFLVVLPVLVAGAFKLGDPRPSRSPGFVDVAKSGAGSFTVFTLFVATGFLLVVVFALFAGDTVASEASWSSLRYLLAMPVPRSHLLARKLVVAMGYALVALVLLPVTAYLAGGLSFGWAPLRTPLGTTLDGWQMVARLALVVVYLALTLLTVSALAFLLGVWTDAPLGAVGGAVLLVIVSNILDAVTALGDWRRALPTHYSYAWVDALAPTVVWDQMARGVLWSLGYSIVLFAAAWWHFERKDIVS